MPDARALQKQTYLQVAVDTLGLDTLGDQQGIQGQGRVQAAGDTLVQGILAALADTRRAEEGIHPAGEGIARALVGIAPVAAGTALVDNPPAALDKAARKGCRTAVDRKGLTVQQRNFSVLRSRETSQDWCTIRKHQRNLSLVIWSSD